MTRKQKKDVKHEDTKWKSCHCSDSAPMNKWRQTEMRFIIFVGDWFIWKIEIINKTTVLMNLFKA